MKEKIQRNSNKIRFSMSHSDSDTNDNNVNIINSKNQSKNNLTK